MGLMERFFGKPDPDAPDLPVVNTAIDKPLGLQVLFAEPVRLDAGRLTQTLRQYHPSLAQATFELDDGLSDKGTPFGLAGWDGHVIRVLGFDAPMPAEAVELCVGPAHYAPEIKEQARAHKEHLLLYYAGRVADPLEQYVALAVVAGVLASQSALLVMNESGHTSLPAEVFAGDKDCDMLEVLRNLPIPALYCGFVKYDVEGVEGVWMRTYGAPLLKLPDLALLAAGHHEGQSTFDLFSALYNYLRSSGAHFAAGHTMEVGGNTFLRLRAPTPEEFFLDSDGELLVAEKSSAGDRNG
jgi:hypothetical protein